MLQRILELQEEATVADHVLAFLQAIGNLRPSAVAIAHVDQAAREFVLFRRGLNVDEGLVFGVMQNGSVRNRQRVSDGAGIDRGGDLHILLQLLAGILRNDARLKSARVGIERGGEVGNFPVKRVGVGVGGDVHAISWAHVGDFALVDVDENPNRAHIRNGEDVCGPA